MAHKLQQQLIFESGNMNKKGFVRTLEAVIAVIIVLGIILVVAPKPSSQQSETPESLKEAQSFILDRISTNEAQRTCIQNLAPTAAGECAALCPSIDTFVQQNQPKGYDYRCEICNSASTCSSALPLDKSLYTDSRLIATTPAKVLRLVFWAQ